jgi:hypothetical protein
LEDTSTFVKLSTHYTVDKWDQGSLVGFILFLVVIILIVLETENIGYKDAISEGNLLWLSKQLDK